MYNWLINLSLYTIGYKLINKIKFIMKQYKFVLNKILHGNGDSPNTNNNKSIKLSLVIL